MLMQAPLKQLVCFVVLSTGSYRIAGVTTMADLARVDKAQLEATGVTLPGQLRHFGFPVIHLPQDTLT